MPGNGGIGGRGSCETRTTMNPGTPAEVTTKIKDPAAGPGPGAPAGTKVTVTFTFPEEVTGKVVTVHLKNSQDVEWTWT